MSECAVAIAVPGMLGLRNVCGLTIAAALVSTCSAQWVFTDLNPPLVSFSYTVGVFSGRQLGVVGGGYRVQWTGTPDSATVVGPCDRIEEIQNTQLHEDDKRLSQQEGS
ncbi:MAG: hypothetical protein ACR2HJ_12685 [Fimbriimonadales bacterium]